MSGIIKGIKKVFKKVVKIIKKIAKPLIIAAAIYFTAGVALSFFGPTAAFAASMPGFAGGGLAGMGIGAGATAGTGVFSSAAAAMGMGSGLAAGAAQVAMAEGGIAGLAAASEGLVSTYGAATASQASGAAVAGAGAATPFVGGTAMPAAVGQAANAASAAVPGLVGAPVPAAPGGWASMSFSDKLLIASTGTQAVSAMVAPSAGEVEEEVQAARARFRGSYYGMTDTGETVANPGGNQAPAPAKIQQSEPTALIRPSAGREALENENLIPMPGPATPAPGQHLQMIDSLLSSSQQPGAPESMVSRPRGLQPRLI